MKKALAPAETPESPFPRHIWIHDATAQDDLDKVCYEIWKRIQRLSEELQHPLLQQILCPELCRTPWADTSTSSSTTNLLDEPEHLESIYKAVAANREREMKLKALCDAQLSAKSSIPSLLYSAKPPRSSRGLEAGSVAGTHSTELPAPLQHPDPAKAASTPGLPEDPKVRRELSSSFSTGQGSTALFPAAQWEATGQQQQPQPLATVWPKADASAATKNPAPTATQDRKDVKYNPRTSGFSTAPASTALHQPVWQSTSFPPLPFFPNPVNVPQFQGPYLQRARIPYQQVLHPPLECYPRQVALYSPQQFFQPPYTPELNYPVPVQPAYLYQQVIPAALPRNMQDLPPVAGSGIQDPFSPGYGFSSRAGGAGAANLDCFSINSYMKF